jgi:hypothetical protein
LPDLALKERTAHGQKGKAIVVLRPPAARIVPGKIPSGIETNSTETQEFFREARQQSIGNHSPAR